MEMDDRELDDVWSAVVVIFFVVVVVCLRVDDVLNSNSTIAIAWLVSRVCVVALGLLVVWKLIRR